MPGLCWLPIGSNTSLGSVTRQDIPFRVARVGLLVVGVFEWVGRGGLLGRCKEQDRDACVSFSKVSGHYRFDLRWCDHPELASYLRCRQTRRFVLPVKIEDSQH